MNTRWGQHAPQRVGPKLGMAKAARVTCSPSTFFLLSSTLILRLSLFMPPIQDRTNEFHSCVESIRSRSAYPRGADAKQRLLRNGKAPTKSDFSRMASTIGKDISSTTIKLGKLAQRAYTLATHRTRAHTHFSGQAENPIRRPTCGD